MIKFIQYGEYDKHKAETLHKVYANEIDGTTYSGEEFAAFFKKGNK